MSWTFQREVNLICIINRHNLALFFRSSAHSSVATERVSNERWTSVFEAFFLLPFPLLVQDVIGVLSRSFISEDASFKLQGLGLHSRC